MNLTSPLLLLILLASCSSCTYEGDETPAPCPSLIDLGQLEWSSETEAWFPETYLDTTTQLIFDNQHGDSLIFDLFGSRYDEGIVDSFELECENGGGRTQVFFADKELTKLFISRDSLIKLYVAIGVYPERLLPYMTEADFYERIQASVSPIGEGYIDNIGFVRIITDLRNAEKADIFSLVEQFQIVENHTFSGQTYPELYLNEPSQYIYGQIYFEKGSGIIGFSFFGNNWVFRK